MSKRGNKKGAPALEKAGTMVTTAAEGEAFLKKAGGVAESRTGNDSASAEEAAPAMEKAGTMVGTAAEGEALLEKAGGAPKGKTRAGDKKAAAAEKAAAKPKKAVKPAAKSTREGSTRSTGLKKAEAEKLLTQLEAQTSKKRKRLNDLERAALEGAGFVTRAGGAKRQKN
eukprot:TRINITY_DN732_c0_g1_i1.p2 TRINITY_DN732_c0_g1~~TRINITY_DN732_c0_g1_i1.p2  ORF type:complete len:170 (-),score=85.08 TRINITY_DN732_c0_g1_i1:234-743(-)